VSAEAAILLGLIPRDRAPLFRNCAYCGDHCYGRACASHRDLIQLDPHVNPEAVARLTSVSATTSARR
jgi:hypothetical protein